MKLNHFLSLLSVMFLIGCTNQETTTTTEDKVSYYDPRIPFGTITDTSGLAGKVLNVTADNSQLNRIILNWTVPPVYTTMNYKVNIYKKRGDDPSFVLPPPADEASAAPLYLRTSITASTFTDQDYLDENNNPVLEIEQGGTYTYWLYLNIDGKWSDGVRIAVTARTQDDTFVFPSAANFWENLRQGYGSPVAAPTPQVPNPIINFTSMNYNPQMTPAIGSPIGGVALAYSGNVMYYADTANNRVVIYTRGLAYSCEQFKNTDPESYLACTFQYASAPLSAVNILGQDSHYSRKSCSNYETQCSSQTSETSCLNTSSICSWKSNGIGGTCSAQQKCLNNPTKVAVYDNKLFVSDSGNNRVVVYNTLPVKGCDKEIIPGSPQPIDCDPSFVIGKKGLEDTTPSYPTSISSLSNPTGVTVDNDNLYIADTGNNRIVMIKNYADSDQFNCTDSDWEVSPCEFSAVLGQKDFNSKWSFKEGSNDGSGLDRTGSASIYDGITCTTPTNCTSPFTTGLLNNEFNSLFMARYFRKPVEVRVVGSKLLVSANEEILVNSNLGTAQLRGRILVWDNNPMIDGANKCNVSLTLNEFDTNNSCMSTKAIGQEIPNKMIIVQNGGRYRDSSFGLDTIDSFDSRNNMLFAVDSLNDYIYQWNDFTDNTLAGTPYTAKVTNPLGRIDNTTGTSRYLPDLKGICDIKIDNDHNYIYVSDPVNGKVYEVRSYNLTQ